MATSAQTLRSPAGARRSSPSGGSGLSKKVGGLPTWGWIGIGVVGLWFAYRYVKAKNTATASTTTATGSSAVSATAAVPTAAGSYGGGGGTTSQVLGTILRQIQVLQTHKTTGTSGASTTYTPPGTETLSGSGYTAPTGKTLVQGATGSTYQYVKTPTQARALLGSGVKLFTQTTPGGFINVTTGNTLGSGTPQFVKVPSKAAG